MRPSSELIDELNRRHARRQLIERLKRRADKLKTPAIVAFVIVLALLLSWHANGTQRVMMGWDVVRRGGGIICRDPYLYEASKEIECD